MEKVTRTQREVKTIDQAIECGTLEVLLSLLLSPHSSTVFISPLISTTPYGGQYTFSYLAHVTTRQHRTGPILYATFRAAQRIGLPEKAVLVFPYHTWENDTEERAQQLQQEMIACLKTLIQTHPLVSQIISPARLRLPDEWAWGVRSEVPHIVYRDEHWVLAKE